MNLTDKHILITGASKGIGKAIEQECIKAGAVCYPADRTHCVDLTKESDIEFLVDRLPSLDGVVFCAGVSSIEPFKYFNNELMKLNYVSSAVICELLIKNHKLNRGASIVFISSIAGLKCSFIGGGAYAASKAALSSIARTMSIELGKREIRVNSVCPGIIITGITDYYDFDFSKHSLKRYGDPDDVAPAVVFLLSDLSKYITGTELVIDGGYTTR